jgi:hypothetical protein
MTITPQVLELAVEMTRLALSLSAETPKDFHQALRRHPLPEYYVEQ